MNTPICPSCNSPVPAGAIFCDNCGFDLRSAAPAQAPMGQPPAVMGMPPAQPQGGIVCPGCGQANVAGAQFCENCGNPLGGQPQQPFAQPQQQYSPPPQQFVPPQGGTACPNCGQANVAGAQFCENCGTPLGGQPPQQYTPPPQQYTPPQQQYVPTPQQYVPPQSQYGQPPQQFGGVVVGRLVVQSSNTSIPIPQGKTEVIIGREDPVSNVFPEVNVDPFGGHDAGVSRQHAKLVMQNGRLMLIDMNTANGTFVNKQKLAPNTPHPVNNGDELRIGGMILKYYAS